MKGYILKYLLILFFVFWATENVLSKNTFCVYEQKNIEVKFAANAKENNKMQEWQNYKKNYSINETKIDYKPLNKQKWEKYKKNRDYQEKPVKQKEESNSKKPNFDIRGLSFLGSVFKMFLYFALVFGFAFIIFKLIEAKFKSDAEIKNEKAFFIEKLEEKIHFTDLDKLLQVYTQKQDFAMMIRIQYLIIIKELSAKNIIKWEVQKTNGNYLQEVFGTSIFESFKNVTQLYERIWFGEVKLNEAIYNKIAPDFLNTLEKIKQL